MKGKYLPLIAAFSLLCGVTSFAQPRTGDYEGLPVELEVPSSPVIPETRANIADYGAVGDGVFLNTAAFESAIRDLSARGGGHLDVGPGIWLTGPIVLKSHVDLHLERGSIVLFTADKRAYFENGTVASGERARACVSAEKASDISITGEGVMDGNGQYWRYAKRDKMSDSEWKDLKSLGGTVSEDGKFWFPYNLKGYANITDSPEKEEAVRQHMIIIKRCSRVLLSGITVQNSPKFHITPNMCTDVVIDGVMVRCPWNAQNGDGIDIGNSRRVMVARCTVDVGDDGICMKGGTGENGVKAGVCSDILIRDNTVLHAHGGFVIGSDVSGGMDRIVVTGCTFSGTDTGLRFKSSVGRGGHCDNIRISNISMNDIKDEAVVFSCDYSDVTYKSGATSGSSVEYAPDFGGIDISDVRCHGYSCAVRAKGIKGLNCIHDVTIRNSVFSSDIPGAVSSDIDKATAEVKLSDVKFL